MRQIVTQRTVLVTGANGYVGNAVAKAFARASWRTYGLSRRKGAVGDLARSEIQPLVGPGNGLALDGLGEVTFDGVVSNTEDQTDPSGHLAAVAIANTLRLLPLIFVVGATATRPTTERKMSSESSNTAAVSVTHHNPSFLWDMSAGGFAQISLAEAGRLAFLSGQVAGASDAEQMPPDLTSQAHIVAANLKKTLTELGASANDIVMVRIYVVNATTDRFQQALTALRDTFSGGKPSITTIGVQALYTPGYQLEVEMVVRVP